MALAQTGSGRGKFIVMLCILCVALLATWEAREWRKTPPPPPAEIPPSPPVTAPAPIPQAPPPTPIPKAEVKRLPAPVQPERKKPSPKRPSVPVSATTPPPAITAPVPVTAPPPLPPIPTTPPPEPKEWQGNDTAITHVGQVVIRSDRQWIQFWSEHHPHEAAPEIDFAHEMVIGVFAGPRPAEQFTISVVQIRSLPASLVVDYRERLPPPGTFAVNVTVYPYQLKVIPRSTLPVKFNGLPPDNVVR